MATAKGLRQAVGAPVVSVPTLDAIAWPFSAFPGIVLPVLDARKGRCYCAIYESGRRVGEYLDIDPVELARLVGDTACLLTGSPASFTARIAQLVPRSFPMVRHGLGEAYATLGVDRFRASGGDPDDAGPLYLRRSDAEEHHGVAR
jgi:tRNA threonylcarbamoyladenosine biosynthesis protein TsaB